MKKAKVLTAALTLGLFISPIISANASVIPKPVYNEKGQVIGAAKTSPTRFIPATVINLPADHYILDTNEADVTGDGVADTIYLAGHKIQPDSPYTDHLSITIKSGSNNSLNTFPMDKVAGYQAHLFVGDFSGDKVPDVYVETASGGSGGWSYHNIISFNGNAPKEIFGVKDNQDLSITGIFIDGWKAELTNNANGKKLAIDVSERQKDYLRIGIYGEDGKVKKETQTMISPFSNLDPIDVDNDGVFELKGIQRISGAYRADGIADVETVLKYTLTDWSLQSVKVSVNMGTASDGIATPKSTTLPAHSINSKNE